MQATSKNLAKALLRSLEAGKSPEDLANGLETYLQKNHLEGLRPKILENLALELRDHERKSSVSLKISHEIKKEAIKKIETLVKKDEKDKTLVSIDPELIGGFRAIYKGVLYDGSVKNYLKELRKVLMQ